MQARNERETAEAAMTAMARHRVPPTPRNFTVWYAHLAGRCNELSKTLDRLIAEQCQFTPARNEELHRLIAAEPDAGRLADASERLHASLQQVLGLIDASRDATAEFGNALDDGSRRLADAPAEEIRAIITRLMRETSEMAGRTQRLGDELVGARSELRELRQSLITAQREALSDGLTGIANRKAFDLRLESAAAAATETGEELGLLLIDIDHFKKFNDRWGHQIGDQVLRLVAQILTESVKGRDLPARFGGEEFAIILPRTALEGAVIVADDIRRTVMRRHIVRKSRGDDLGTITLSAGVSSYRLGENLSETIRRADQALYLAKNSGRNCVRDERALACVSA